MPKNNSYRHFNCYLRTLFIIYTDNYLACELAFVDNWINGWNARLCWTIVREKFADFYDRIWIFEIMHLGFMQNMPIPKVTLDWVSKKKLSIQVKFKKIILLICRNAFYSTKVDIFESSIFLPGEKHCRWNNIASREQFKVGYKF